MDETQWCIYQLRPVDYKNDNNFYIGRSRYLDTDKIMKTHKYMLRERTRSDLTMFHNNIEKNGGLKKWDCFIIEIFGVDDFKISILEREKYYQTILNPKWKNNIDKYFINDLKQEKTQYFNKDYINFIYNFNNQNIKEITSQLRKLLPDELVMMIFSFLKAEDINKKLPETCECGAPISSNMEKHKRTRKHLDIVDGPIKNIDDLLKRAWKLTKYH